MSTAGRNTYRYKQLAADLRRLQRPCWICQQPINYHADPEDGDAFSVDHVKPLSTHPELAEVFSNMAAAHLRCNKSKGNRTAPAGLGTPSEDW